MKFTIFFYLFLIIAPACYSQKGHSHKKNNPKNIILMIGDGMGIAHIFGCMTVNQGWLNLEKFKYIGLIKTYSADNFITDSGAAGTAIATGKKTYNGAIGVGIDSLPLKTILEYAEEYSLSTGLIATSSITHATPASFIAHQVNRNMYEEIAEDFMKTDIDLFIGGGKNHFKHRKDSIDLTDSLQNRGYQIAYDTNDIKINKQERLAALLADVAMPKMSEGRGNMLPLAVETAVERLSKNKKGFFLMVEGSQIDWACHDTDSYYMVQEMLDFDRAVGKALEFAEKDGNTLVIVTSDHETGGVAVTNGNFKTGSVEIKFVSDQHTAVPVPVFAFGPGAERFAGIYENTELFFKMMESFGFLH